MSDPYVSRDRLDQLDRILTSAQWRMKRDLHQSISALAIEDLRRVLFELASIRDSADKQEADGE